MKSVGARLAKLQTIWPPAPCAECQARPAVMCIAEGEEPPRLEEGPCPACGQQRFTVPTLVGVDCDAI